MFIKKLSYKDHTVDWSIKELEFNKFTLLVGASGVGKTMILNALKSLREISNGSSIKGIEWELEFNISDDSIYKWKGEFEKQSLPFIFHEKKDDISLEKDNEQKLASFVYEELSRNNEVIFKRNKNEIIFNNQATPKLSSKKSIIELLKEEDLIKPIYEGLRKFYFSDYSNSQVVVNDFEFFLNFSKKLPSLFNSLGRIQNSDIPLGNKLYLLSKLEDNSTFELITKRFMDIFPFIEGVKFEKLEELNEDVPEFLAEFPFIQIKEKGINNWIKSEKISSGMLRTLIQLSELYLSPDGAVIFIDEFENSLGINCIDEITNDMLSSERDLQFIITSHHPYIINNIEPKYWKMITRKGGEVKAHDMSDKISTYSRIEYFLQLIQLDEFNTGAEE